MTDQAADLVHALLPELDGAARQVLLAYSVHQYANGAGAHTVGPDAAARALAAGTGRAWTATAVEQAHAALDGLLFERVGGDDELLGYVVALLTFRLVEGMPGP